MPTSGRPRDLHKEQFWRQTLQRFAASRLSATRFCQLHKLPLHSFWAWKRTLQLRDQQSRTTAPGPADKTPQASGTSQLPFFLPLQLQQPPADSTARSSTALEVLLPNGLRLRVPQHFDPATLQQLLALLRGASC